MDPERQQECNESAVATSPEKQESFIVEDTDAGSSLDSVIEDTYAGSFLDPVIEDTDAESFLDPVIEDTDARSFLDPVIEDTDARSFLDPVIEILEEDNDTKMANQIKLLKSENSKKERLITRLRHQLEAKTESIGALVDYIEHLEQKMKQISLISSCNTRMKLRSTSMSKSGNCSD